MLATRKQAHSSRRLALARGMRWRSGLPEQVHSTGRRTAQAGAPRVKVQEGAPRTVTHQGRLTTQAGAPHMHARRVARRSAQSGAG